MSVIDWDSEVLVSLVGWSLMEKVEESFGRGREWREGGFFHFICRLEMFVRMNFCNYNYNSVVNNKFSHICIWTD